MIKNPPANAGDAREVGSIPGVGNGNPPSNLVWKIPWTEEPGGLYSPWGHKESDMTERLHSHFSNLEKHFFFL